MAFSEVVYTSWSVGAQPAAPVWDSTIPDQLMEAGSPIDPVHVHVASDTTGNITYSVSSLASGFDFDAFGNLYADATVVPGTYSITVTATNIGGSIQQTFDWVVTEALTVPEWAAIADVTVNEGTAATRDIDAATSNAGAITYTLTAQAGFSLAGTIVTGADTLQAGAYTVEVIATNSQGSSSQTFTYTVSEVLTVPVWGPIADVSVDSGTQGTREIDNATGDDGAIVYTLTPQEGFSLSGTTLTGADTLAVGAYTVEIIATNDVGPASQTFTYTVNAVYMYSNILYGEFTPPAA